MSHPRAAPRATAPSAAPSAAPSTVADRRGDSDSEGARRLVRHADPAVRGELAGRDDLRPEMLYILAGDDSSEVRRRVAGNARAPDQANLLLARDDDPLVRGDLAAKVARLLPRLDDKDREEARHHVLRTLEILVHDQTVRVRRLLAETLKEMTAVPEAAIRRLAEDADESVAGPVLEFSPLLSDRDLLRIVDHGCASGRLAAISRRRGLAAPVADAVVATEDSAAIAALLANASAQIREETLDRIIDQAPRVAAWHAPLVHRPRLSPGAVRKLAGFVAEGLLERLRARDDLDRETADLVARELRKRLADGDADGDARPGAEPESAAERVETLHSAGKLTEAAIARAMTTGDRDFVHHALTLLSESSVDRVENILRAGSPQGVAALAWKCGLSMAFATQLQVRMGAIAPQQALRARPDGGFPLSEKEMRWQLTLFENMIG